MLVEDKLDRLLELKQARNNLLGIPQPELPEQARSHLQKWRLKQEQKRQAVELMQEENKHKLMEVELAELIKKQEQAREEVKKKAESAEFMRKLEEEIELVKKRKKEMKNRICIYIAVSSFVSIFICTFLLKTTHNLRLYEALGNVQLIPTLILIITLCVMGSINQ